MMFDEAVEAFATSKTRPDAQIQWVLDQWETTAAECRSNLANYLDGKDWSERTEQSLLVIILLLGEKLDRASFPDLCRLAVDRDRCNSVLGEDDAHIILASALISTFDGTSGALYRIVESPEADGLMRGQVLAALAYLVRTERVAEAEFYQYLSHLPDRLPDATPDAVWCDWAWAVAMLGFAGLSHRVEQAMQCGRIKPESLASAVFWEELRAAQADPKDMSGPAWDYLGPIGTAIGFMRDVSVADSGETVYEAPPEPVRNPLRHVGRNDPCPCGSGKKFKKCCLAA